MPNPAQALSFRDPAGRVRVSEETVLRLVSTDGAQAWELYAQSPTLDHFRKEGRLITFESTAHEHHAPFPASARDKAYGLYKHPKISFPNYPHEWPSAMLAEAGHLTLDLAEALLSENAQVKDATPFNVMFEGPCPVFIDALSFERREPADALWLAEAQFLRTFVFPLLYAGRLKMPLASVFLSNREGLTTDQALGLLGPFERWKPSVLLAITLPALLDRRAKTTWTEKGVKAVRAQERTPQEALYILGALFKRLRKLLMKAYHESKDSHWSHYGARRHYTDEATAFKKAFVEDCLKNVEPSRTLDIGCNLGEFTRLAASYGAVVAIDSDPDVVGSLWHMAKEEKLPILPLVQNIAAPTPATGWAYQETTSFLSRAKDGFDCVMMLAVLHHILVSERIPLSDLIDTVANLTTDSLIIEYVDPKDPMFISIARGRDDLFSDLSEASFRHALEKHFMVVRTAPVPGLPRTMFFARKK